MTNKDIRNAFDSITPDQAQKETMLGRILTKGARKERTRTPFFKRTPVLATAAAALVVCAAILSTDLIGGLPFRLSTGDKAAPPAAPNPNLVGEGLAEDADGRDIAPLTDIFELGGRHYSKLYKEQSAAFSVPLIADESQAGELLGRIDTAVDQSLIGLDVYRYAPLKGEAVVLVLKGGEYQAFIFQAFGSYLKNGDENMDKYLALYGIDGAQDIARVELFVYSPDKKDAAQRSIGDRQVIEALYGHLAALRETSRQYFDALMGVRKPPEIDQGNTEPADGVLTPEEEARLAELERIKLENEGKPLPEPIEDIDPVPPEERPAPDSEGRQPLENETGDLPATTTNGDLPQTSTAPQTGRDTPKTDGGNSSSEDVPGQAPGSPGSNVLSYVVVIRLHTAQGLFLDIEYYPDFGFARRHAVPDAFKTLIEAQLK